MLLAGVPPSALRAGLTGSVYLLAMATGRGASPLNALAMAALLMVAWEPRWLWHLSFQLSFAAMTGVVLLGLPAWARLREGIAKQAAAGPLALRLGTAVGGGIVVSGRAVLGSPPLVAFSFHQIPLLGIPATLITLPVLPGILVGGLATAVLASVWAPLGWAAAWAPWLLGKYVELVVDGVSQVPWAVIEVGGMGPALVWGYYGALAGVMALVLRRRWLPEALRMVAVVWRGPDDAWRRLAVLAVVGLVAAVLWAGGLNRTDNRLHLYVLDVGQGDAIFLRTPGGHNLMVDGGPDPRVTLAALDRILPFNDRTIDVALLSHPQADHMNGLLTLARRNRVERMGVPPPVPGESEQPPWRADLEVSGVELVEGSAGMLITLPDGVLLEILHPPLPPLSGTSSDLNNNSLVVLVRHEQAAALLTGDLEAVGELALLDSRADLSAQVLKVGHHGSDSSSTAEFLRAAQPAVVAISAGRDNPFGHPAAPAVARLEAVVTAEGVFQTAEHGTIELTTDGVRWWVKTAR